MRRFALLPILVALALLAASCGGSTSTSGAGSSAGASVAPASAPVFVTIDTDPGSGQWKQAETLLDKFPGKQKLLDAIDRELTKQGVSYEQDVKPALGPEVDIAVLGLEEGSRDVVGMVQPADKAKLQALLAKVEANDPSSKAVTTEYKGWTLVSDKQSSLDRFEAEADKGAIADDATFQEAMAKESGDALVKAYANGAALNQLIDRLVARSGSGCTGTTATAGNVKLRYVSGGVSVESDGVRLQARMRSDGATSSGGGSTAKLLDEIPAGALAVLAFHGTDQFTEGWDQLQGCGAQIQQGLGAVESLLGVKFKELGALFANDSALYVRAGTPIPEVTLLSHQSDPEAALATIDKLARNLGGLAGAGAPRDTTIAGTPVKEIVVGGRVSIFYAALSDKVVVTDSRTGFQDLLESSGSKLKDDPAFKSAQEASGMPSDTPFFFYVDIQDSLSLVESLVQLAGTDIPPDVDANLRPLRSFVYYASGSADDVELNLFLQVQ
jgi:hypothetical protein